MTWLFHPWYTLKRSENSCHTKTQTRMIDLGPWSQNESKRPRWSPTMRWNLRIRAYERDQVWNRVACGITRSVSHGLSEISGWQSYVTWNMAETHAIRVRDFLFQSWTNYIHRALVITVSILLGNVLGSSLTANGRVQIGVVPKI